MSRWIGIPSLLVSFALFVCLQPDVTAQKSSHETAMRDGVPGADFYVSPAGRDSWSGTAATPNSDGTDGPFATFDRARTAASELWRRVSRTGRKDPVTVMFKAGTYSVKQAVVFSNGDSGSSNLQIVYQNFPDQTAVISGGVRVQNWTHVSGNKWQTTLPASTQYFEQLFYNGQRRLRPRLGGYLGKYYRVEAPVVSSPGDEANCRSEIAERFGQQPGGSGRPGPGGRRNQRQMFPAEPVANENTCFDRFQYSASDPISANWANSKPPYPAGDIEIYIFERWTVSKLRVQSIDPRNHLIYFSGPTRKDSRFYGFIPGHRYIVENVKEALSEAGQWFLDRSSSPWILTYLANPGENPNNDTVMIPLSPQVLVANGLQYVTFKGLTFAHDNWTIPAEGYVSIQSEPNIPAAVSCANCQHVSFDDDTITQTSGGGLEFVTNDENSTTAYNTFENGAIYDIGGAGVRIGKRNAPNDTDDNVPHFITVKNTVIAGYSRVMPSGMGIVQGNGHDNLYTHNDIYNGYHAAISICAPGCPPSPRGSRGVFNVTTSFNHIYDIMKGITGDGGALYYATGGPRWSGSGNRILNNKVHDVNDDSVLDQDGNGGQGIYLDFQTGLVDVENNLVYRVSGMPMFISKGVAQNGWANTIKNNIFAFGRGGMLSTGTPTAWLQGCPGNPILMFNFTNNILYFDRTDSSPGTFFVQRGCAYSCGFPYNQYQNWHSNIYWRKDGGFQSDPRAFHYKGAAPPDPRVNCQNGPHAWDFVNFSQWQDVPRGVQLNEDAGSVVKDPGFRNPADDDYSLPKGSPGAGFVVFDVNAPGRSNPVIKAPDVADTFPTAAYRKEDF